MSSSYYGADPFREMRRLQSEMNRVFEANTSARAAEFPPINAYANQDGAVITAELPGVKSDDLNVSVHRDSVTLSSERGARRLRKLAAIIDASGSTDGLVERWPSPFRSTRTGLKRP